MSVSFPRVDEVAVGDRVSARNLSQLSAAINARIVSGLGDGAWRLVMYWLNAFRQIRNPDVTQTLWPPQAEFFTSYQGLSPQFQWPDAGPGEPEGANVNSLVGSYVFGSSQAGVNDEATRLVIDGVPVESADSPSAAWELGKKQRGAVDPTTGGIASPTLAAAVSYGPLTRSEYSNQGAAYGGFFAVPELTGATCADSTPSQILKFTNYKTNAVQTYSGTCPETPGNVAAFYRLPLGFYLVFNGGSVVYLPRSEWIEGPYTTGQRPAHTWGDHLPRAMAQFSAEFRGTSDQRDTEVAGKAPWLGNAFNIAQFLTRPYYLAPSVGTEISTGQVVPTYPKTNIAQAAGSVIAAGTKIGGSHKTRDGFGMVGVYVDAAGLYDSMTVTVYNGDAAIGSLTVSRTSPQGVLWFDSAVSGSDIKAVVSNSTRFATAGGVTVEWAELLNYKPGLQDLFLVLRLSGSKTVDAYGSDGSGISEDAAAALWESYKTGGCIRLSSSHDELESKAYLGDNALYDTMRRMSKVIRWFGRDHIVGYAVENGNSVVWVNPNYTAVPRAANTTMVDGIADEIAHVAPKGGYTNEWCGFINAHPYHVSESSIWKPSSFSDQYPIIDRCLFYTGTDIGADADFKRYITWNGTNYASSPDVNLTIVPEAPSGYRYARNANSSPSDPNFFKACRIYEPPLAVDSAITEADGNVKITFKGRFHHHDSAPATIARDVGTWDIAALTAEADEYRTEENAIREYLVHARGSGSYQCSRLGAGNSQSKREVYTLTDKPFGACYPTLFLVQLLPKPYLDGNENQGTSDTPLDSEPLRRAELYLRVVCEGFVDKLSTETIGCSATSVFDFKFDQLCYQAHGLPWLLPIGDKASKYLPASEVRTDQPEGFGPMPTTRAAASVFNGFAKATNLLDRVRVALPWDLETDRSATGNSTVDATGMYRSDGAAADCSTYSTGGLLWSGAQPNASIGAFTGIWSSAPYAASVLDTVVANSGGAYSCNGSRFQLYSERYDEKFRFSVVSTASLQALPEAWRDQLNTDAEFVATLTTLTRRVSWTQTTAGSGEPCGGSDGWVTPGGALLVPYTDTTVTVCTRMRTSGTLHVPPQRSINLAASSDGSTLCDAGGSYSSGVTSQTLSPQDQQVLILPVPLTDGDPAT